MLPQYPVLLYSQTNLNMGLDVIPRSGFLSTDLLARYRGRGYKASWAKSYNLLILLILRDLRVRYRGSVLGYLWSMMNPLLYMGVLSFVFSHIMRFDVEHFPMFILSGILIWNLFAQGLSIGVHSIVANGSLLRKVRVPVLVFPAASVGSVLVNFVLALFPYLLIALVSGVELTGWFLLLPVLLIPYIMFVYGLILTLASLNVKFRDVGHVMDPLLSIFFYASPIIYPLAALPEKYMTLAWLNPMTTFITLIRNAIFDGHFPAFKLLAASYGFGFLALAIGFLVFFKLKDEFVYNV